MINKLHLLKPLLRAVETNTLKDRFPLSQRVTYNFFRGRKQLFENQFDEAISCLTFAFERCHQSSEVNQRQILMYLIPVKMLKGILPSKQLLKQHNLESTFLGITTAIKIGNLELFDSTIDSNMAVFVKNRTLITVEKLRTLVERTLFRKIHKIIAASKTVNNHLLPIKALHDCLSDYENKIRDNYDQLDELETECIASGMIYKGLMKGYIAHTHGKIVLSKKEPFPEIAVVQQ